MSNQEEINKLVDADMAGDQPDLNNMDFMNALGSMMGGMNGGEGEEGDNFDFNMIMQEMMKQFTSKEALYEPCKEIIPKYEEYLSTKTDLSAEDKEKYTQQKEAYVALLDILDNNENDSEAIMNAIEKINSLGEPPAEIAPADDGEGEAAGPDAGEGCNAQ